MGFITPFCTSVPDRSRLTLALALLLTAGCSHAQTDFGFSLVRVETQPTADALNVAVHQKLVLSREARNALNHGVPLAIQTELELRQPGSGHGTRQEHRSFEIRYLPLSERYQLTTVQPFSVATFPRLRHVLAELDTVKFTLPLKPAAAGVLELRVRSFLDKRHMPPPMRLPVWFSSQWRHDSGWRTWPVVLAPNT